MEACSKFRAAPGAGLLVAACLGIALLPTAGCDGSASSGGRGSGDVASTSDARAVLRSMVEAYQKARTYADSGELRFRAVTDGQEESQPPLPFSVALARPNKLRLHAYNCSVVSDGTKFWATNQQLADQVVSRAAPEKLALADLGSDKILAASLRGAIDVEPPQLQLLLGDGDAGSLPGDAARAKLLADQKLGEATCRRVEVPSEDGPYVYWIDAESRLLRRLELPTKRLRKLLDPDGRATSLEAWVELTGARLDGTVGAHAFEFEPPRGVAILKRFLESPPEPPPPLLGQTPGAFTFTDLEGNAIEPKQLEGKIVVMDMWATWCGWCFKGLPHLEKVYQKYKNNAGVRFLAVSGDEPSVTNEQLQASFDKAGLTIPIARDLSNHGETLFQVRGLPTTFLLGRDGAVQDLQAGYEPDAAEKLTSKLEKLLSGKNLAKERLDEYQQKRADYERQRSEALASVTTEVEIPRPVIAPVSKPRALRLEKLWDAADVKQPGNMLVIQHSGEAPRIIVCDGARMVVELDAAGKQAARHELEIPAQTGVTYLRTAVDAQNKRYFAAFASGEQQFYLFDDAWKLLVAYPHADVGRHAGIGDVQLADLDGDGQPEAYVGFWGQVGVQAVSLQGRRLWSNRALESVLRTAIVQSEPDQPAQLLCSNGRGTLVAVEPDGRSGKEIAIPNRALHTVVAAELDGQAPNELCCLTTTDGGATLALGATLAGKELWRHPLPAGIHARPIEIVTAGHVFAESPGQWLLAGPDGSVHVIAHDGKLVDRFSTGKTLTGLATALVDSQPVLLIATTDGLAAWRVSRSAGAEASPTASTP